MFISQNPCYDAYANLCLQIVPGAGYKFSVWVETHLGELSENKTAIVARSEDEQPLIVDLGADQDEVDPQRDVYIKAFVQVSDCVDTDVTGGIRVGVFNHRFLRYANISEMLILNIM